jgi:hypothetical protein
MRSILSQTLPRRRRDFSKTLTQIREERAAKPELDSANGDSHAQCSSTKLARERNAPPDVHRLIEGQSGSL